MRITPIAYYLEALAERWPPGSLYYMSPEDALRNLHELTGQDFGHDVQAWQRWAKEHRADRLGWAAKQAGARVCTETDTRLAGKKLRLLSRALGLTKGMKTSGKPERRKRARRRPR